MKQAFPNILKFAGALAITTAIFFLLSPEKNIDDKVLNASMEFLGNKLLAMVPQDQKLHVEKEFEAFREQTRNGKVSDQQFEGVAVAILNAEAEGRRFERHEVDSLLAAIKESEAAKAEDEARRREELIALSERVQAFQEFEMHWKKMLPPSPPGSTVPRAPMPHPLYRIANNFVVEIDTAAIAEMAAHAEHFAAPTPKVLVMPPREVFRKLTHELPALKFEMRKFKLQMADSLQKVFVRDPQYQHEMRRATVQIQMADSVRKAFERDPRFQYQMYRAMPHAQNADSLRKAREQYRRAHPDIEAPPLPPLPPEVPKSEQQKPPQ